MHLMNVSAVHTFFTFFTFLTVGTANRTARKSWNASSPTVACNFAQQNSDWKPYSWNVYYLVQKESVLI